MLTILAGIAYVVYNLFWPFWFEARKIIFSAVFVS